MSKKSGGNAVLILTDAGDAARTLSGYVQSIDWNFKGRTLVDTTAMGDGGRKFSSNSLQEGTFSVTFWWDDGDNTVKDTLFDATNGLMWEDDAAKAFEFGPEGGSNGDIKFTGTCWLEDAPIPASVGEMMQVTATFRIESTVTVGSYSA